MLMNIYRNSNGDKNKTSEAEGHLGDDCAGNGKADKERPVTFPLSLEENGPRIEFPHLSPLSLSFSPPLCFFSLPGVWK